ELEGAETHQVQHEDAGVNSEDVANHTVFRLGSSMLPLALLLTAFGSFVTSSPAAGPHLDDVGAVPVAVCAAEGPAYYAFELFTTKNIPGTGLAKGQVEVSVSGTSPFSIALGPDGSYVYDVEIGLDRMRVPRQGQLVAWVTTPEIDQITRLGPLDDNLRGSGVVGWNRFIVVITLETGDDPTAERWAGPIVFRGMSRSGMMHTMIGHGALQQENCQAFGYGNE
ncbi:MAG: hypothetical protein ACKVIN_13560, partial [Longimicrobiales bacterium]